MKKVKNNSDFIAVEKFIEICKINNVNTQEELESFFPNINPYEEPEPEPEYEDDNEWAYREAMNDEYVRQANRDFYSEFGNHFHEDML